MTTGLRTWFDKAGPLAQSLTGLAALIALIAVVLLLWRGTRALRGKKAADTLTVVAAAMASSVAATGMWHFFSRTMHLPTWIQAVLFAFMEISVLASALRARANVARDGQAGADGLAVWVLTSASGLMSASEATSPQEALVRLGAPLVAAWLWERSMVPERRAKRAAQGSPETAVRWLFSVKRIAVRLGLATALGADLETEDANRRIDRFVRADTKAQRAGALTRRRAARRRDRAHARLMEQARMQADPRALYSHLGRQAILDVLARLGGDDAVIDRERARQMQHILADAATQGPSTQSRSQGPSTEAPAAAGAGASAAAGGTGTRRARSAAPVASAPAQSPSADSVDPMVTQLRDPALDPAYAEYSQYAGHAGYAGYAQQQAPLVAAAPLPRQDELPLQLPEQPIPSAPHIPAARQHEGNGTSAGTLNGAAANGAYGLNGTSGTNGANGNTVGSAVNGQPRAAARAQIPVEPVRFVAATLPEPQPEPAPAYGYDDAEPEPEQPAAPVIDHDLADRITRAMANSPIPPNLLKLANEIGISPGAIHDTIDALGGYNAVWSRVRQDRDAETADTDAAFYSA